jgi:hypothetical protein
LVTATQRASASLSCLIVSGGVAWSRSALCCFNAVIACGVVACSIVAMLACTPATVSRADSMGAGSFPLRFVSQIPMHLAIRVVSSSAVSGVGAAATDTAVAGASAG